MLCLVCAVRALRFQEITVERRTSRLSSSCRGRTLTGDFSSSFFWVWKCCSYLIKWFTFFFLLLCWWWLATQHVRVLFFFQSIFKASAFIGFRKWISFCFLISSLSPFTLFQCVDGFVFFPSSHSQMWQTKKKKKDTSCHFLSHAGIHFLTTAKSYLVQNSFILLRLNPCKVAKDTAGKDSEASSVTRWIKKRRMWSVPVKPGSM